EVKPGYIVTVQTELPHISINKGVIHRPRRWRSPGNRRTLQPQCLAWLVSAGEMPVGICDQAIFLFDWRIGQKSRKVERAARGDFEIVFLDRKPFFGTGTRHCEANKPSREDQSPDGHQGSLIPLPS